jgi:hypothetical protein
MLHFIIRLCTQSIGFAFISFTFFACSSIGQVSNKGTIQLKTHFYNANGKPTFTHYLKIWYKDSVTITENTGVNTETDTANIETVTYPIILYRYIDLQSKTLYDYKNFSDTAEIINKAVLPDSLMTDIGWSFYSEKAPKIQGIPEPLSDTVIDNITYKRTKFSFAWHDPQKNFLIGYLRCDGKGDMFSLEKAYSRKFNCAMVKYFSYKFGMARPYASKEVYYISDTLTKEELKVFEAWERNAKEKPVKK